MVITKMEEKKKVFPWKKVAIVVVIILLVVAMSPLFWTNLMIYKLALDNPLDSSEDLLLYADDRICVYISPDYEEKYENKQFTKESFKSDNVESIEYIGDNYIVVYLKKTGFEEISKAIAKFRTLKFVSWTYLSRI